MNKSGRSLSPLTKNVVGTLTLLKIKISDGWLKKHQE
jgi:hypothetical protein